MVGTVVNTQLVNNSTKEIIKNDLSKSNALYVASTTKKPRPYSKGNQLRATVEQQLKRFKNTTILVADASQWNNSQIEKLQHYVTKKLASITKQHKENLVNDMESDELIKLLNELNNESLRVILFKMIKYGNISEVQGMLCSTTDADVVALLQAKIEQQVYKELDGLDQHEYPKYPTDTTTFIEEIAIGQAWVNEHTKFFAPLRGHYQIVYWSDLLRTEDYPQLRRKIDDLYKNEEKFKNIVEAGIDKFISPPLSSEEAQRGPGFFREMFPGLNPELARNSEIIRFHVRQYILNDCTGLLAFRKLVPTLINSNSVVPDCLIYPTPLNAAMDYINAHPDFKDVVLPDYSLKIENNKVKVNRANNKPNTETNSATTMLNFELEKVFLSPQLDLEEQQIRSSMTPNHSVLESCTDGILLRYRRAVEELQLVLAKQGCSPEEKIDSMVRLEQGVTAVTQEMIDLTCSKTLGTEQYETNNTYHPKFFTHGVNGDKKPWTSTPPINIPGRVPNSTSPLMGSPQIVEKENPKQRQLQPK